MKSVSCSADEILKRSQIREEAAEYRCGTADTHGNKRIMCASLESL